MVCLLLAGVELKIVVYPTSALIHLPPTALYCWPPSYSKLLQDQFVFASLEKKSQCYKSQQFDIFLNWYRTIFFSAFREFFSSKKSNWNCLPPHPHNFRSTICFPAFQPHRDQAIKCECENFKVFSLLCDEFNANQFKCQAQISFGARCSFPSCAAIHWLYSPRNSRRLQFSFLAV